MSVLERDVNTIVSEISSKAWRVRDLYDSAKAAKTRTEGMDLTKAQQDELKTNCKAVCDEIKTLAGELKTKVV